MSEHRAETIALCGGHFLQPTSARAVPGSRTVGIARIDACVTGPDRAFDAVTA